MTTEVENIHSQNHFGVNKIEFLCANLFFKIKREVIRKFVEKCLACSQAIKENKKFKIKNILASCVFERLQMDCVDMNLYSEQNDEFRYILNIVNVYSKFLISYPLRTKSSKEVTQLIENTFLLFGTPKILQSDNGKEFANTTLTLLLNRYNAK